MFCPCRRFQFSSDLKKITTVASRPTSFRALTALAVKVKQQAERKQYIHKKQQLTVFYSSWLTMTDDLKPGKAVIKIDNSIEERTRNI